MELYWKKKYKKDGIECNISIVLLNYLLFYSLVLGIVYIELNAVKAKIIKSPNDWKWSSYNAHANPL